MFYNNITLLRKLAFPPSAPGGPWAPAVPGGPCNDTAEHQSLSGTKSPRPSSPPNHHITGGVMSWLNSNDGVILGSRLDRFSPEVPGVLCPLGLPGDLVVQVGPRGSLSRRPTRRQRHGGWRRFRHRRSLIRRATEMLLTFRSSSDRSAAFPWETANENMNPESFNHRSDWGGF